MSLHLKRQREGIVRKDQARENESRHPLVVHTVVGDPEDQVNAAGTTVGHARRGAENNAVGSAATGIIDDDLVR